MVPYFSVGYQLIKKSHFYYCYCRMQAPFAQMMRYQHKTNLYVDISINKEPCYEKSEITISKFTDG